MLGEDSIDHSVEVLAETLTQAWQVPPVPPPDVDKASQLIEIISPLWPALGRPCSKEVVDQALWQWAFTERVSSGLYLMHHGHHTEGRAYLDSAERLVA
jgi:hypothetical protein